MQKILITGGSGMVGKHLRELMPNAYYVNSNDYDMRDYSQTRMMFKFYKPDVVVHLAAKVGGIIANTTYPADFYDDNILINTNAMRAARDFNCRQFIGILSTCIYPDALPASRYPLNETHLFSGPPPPTNAAYAMSKRALAVQIDAYNRQYGTQYNYLIPCNLYSEYDHFESHASHFVAALLQKIYLARLKKENSITLFGTGKPLRQFMYAGDLAKVIQLCIEHKIYENFNVATPETLSIREIAKIALKACDVEYMEIKYDKTKPDGQFRKDVSIKELKKYIPGFEPTTLYEGIKRTYKKHFEK